MSLLICPKCGKTLEQQSNTMRCPNNHCYDMAKEGYVNLLLTTKNGDKIGDSKESARARHGILAKDYYKCLKDAITKKMRGTVLDICCGEGYYDRYDGLLYGFDISKEMIRLASKSHSDNHYFVANLSNIPIRDNSIDTAIHLFAPFNDKEFARVLKRDGTLYSVIPGENHLYEMKEILYDTPYKNDEQAPDSTHLILTNRERIKDTVSITADDLKQLFSMTPYYYRTGEDAKHRLDDVDTIQLTVDFIILTYKKP